MAQVLRPAPQPRLDIGRAQQEIDRRRQEAAVFESQRTPLPAVPVDEATIDHVAASLILEDRARSAQQAAAEKAKRAESNRKYREKKKAETTTSAGARNGAPSHSPAPPELPHPPLLPPSSLPSSTNTPLSLVVRLGTNSARGSASHIASVAVSDADESIGEVVCCGAALHSNVCSLLSVSDPSLLALSIPPLTSAVGEEASPVTALVGDLLGTARSSKGASVPQACLLPAALPPPPKRAISPPQLPLESLPLLQTGRRSGRALKLTARALEGAQETSPPPKRHALSRGIENTPHLSLNPRSTRRNAGAA